MMNEEKKHKRRPHYSGTHPKNYREKYKELNPDKYQDTIQKVISKGSTPAGMHLSIMVDEILDGLMIRPGMHGCDCTFGYGGHSEAMLKALKGQGHLLSLDIDPIESVKSEKRLRDLGYGEELFSVEHLNFAQIDEAAHKYGKFDFILADLGVSSMQIDNPDRGFSYKLEGPLDLRMDPQRGKTAAECLRELTEPALAAMLQEYSDEPYADQIAAVISANRKKGQKIETTRQLRAAIEEALRFLPKKEYQEAVKKSCARVFQALRIEVNREYDSLYTLLEKLPDVLVPGGRVAILTFHSGEDRLVKQAFRDCLRGGLYSDVTKDVIRPSAQECSRNPRARSTKLRIAVRA